MEIKGKQIWKENKIEQKRTKKRTKETEKKKQFFKFQGEEKQERKNEWRIAVVCTINKICAGENTSRNTSEEPQEPQNQNYVSFVLQIVFLKNFI